MSHQSDKWITWPHVNVAIVRFNLSLVGSSTLKHTTHHKEHLPLVLVWQQEETQYSGVGDLIVKSLTMQVQEGGVDTNIIPERKTLTEPNKSLKYRLCAALGDTQSSRWLQCTK